MRYSWYVKMGTKQYCKGGLREHAKHPEDNEAYRKCKQCQLEGKQWLFCIHRVAKKRTEKENNGKNNQKKIMKKKQKIQYRLHQHNTDDGGQAMGEELGHVQISR